MAWTFEKVYDDGDEFFRDYCEAIRNAQSEILIETYIWEWDPLGDRILSHLTEAIKRGVAVQVLLDGAGCFKWSLSQLERVENLGIQTRVFHPMPWHNSFPNFLLNLQPKKWIRGWLKFTKRNHRKVMIVDQKIGFVGGMNISAKHCKEFYGNKAWLDLSCQLAGPPVQTLRSIFLQTWNTNKGFFRFSQFSDPKIHLNVRMNATNKMRRMNRRRLFQQLDESRSHIWIATAYFFPIWSMLIRLKKSVQRGVDVRIVYSKKTDLWFMDVANRVFTKYLLVNGVRVFEYSSSVLHAKAMVIDSSVLIGSSNMNQRSFRHDHEVDVLLQQPSSKKKLKNFFESTWANSHELKKSRAGSPSLVQRFVLLFKRWL